MVARWSRYAAQAAEMASRTSSLTCGWRCAACSSSTWTRAASSATRALSSATVSLVTLMLPAFFGGRSRSQRDKAVLLRRTRLALGREILQRASELAPGIRGLDDVIDQTTCSRDIRRGERVAVQLHKLSLLSDRVRRGGDLLTEDHPCRTLGTHHRDLSSRPREHPVGAQVLAAHGQVRATIGLTQHGRCPRWRAAGYDESSEAICGSSL